MVQVEDYTHVPSRDILCVDVKSFFASVECVKRGLDPLQAFLVVMSNADRAGGLVLAASPQMKKVFRIKTGSRKFEVPEDDPRIIIAPPRMQLYLHVNELIQKIFLRYVAREDFHVYSIDEAFLDVTHSKKLFGSAEVIAKKIQADILKELRLHVTVGIGDNPLLAKLALDNAAKHQSDGIAEWRYKDVPETVWKIRPITEFWGIGKRTAFQLERMGIYSIYGLSQMPPSYLKKGLGIIGEQLYYHAHGIDYSRLSEKYKPLEKSYGKSQILEKDYHDPNQVAIIIQEMVEEVAMRLRNHHVDTSIVHLSCGYSRYSLNNGFSHQKKIMATNSSKELVPYFLEMFWKYQENDAVRSIAVSCAGIQRKTSMQLSVFEDYTKTLQQEQLERTIDKIRDRYGFKALMHANSLIDGATGLKRSALLGGHLK